MDILPDREIINELNYLHAPINLMHQNTELTNQLFLINDFRNLKI